MINSFQNLTSGTTALSPYGECGNPFVSDFNSMEEIFIPIYQFNLQGKYEISNFQRIRTVRVRNRWGWYKPKKERIIKQFKNEDGYLIVTLTDMNCKPTTFGVHRLMAAAFIPNPKNKPQVNHLNSIRHDNRVENLEWCTQSENQLHSVKFGYHSVKSGEDSPISKLTNKQALLIADSKKSTTFLAKKFGVHNDTILAVKNGKSFSIVTGILPIKKTTLDRSGSKHYYTKFSDSDVIDIYKSKEKYKVLCKKYNVCLTTISAIKRGQNWSHLTKGLNRG